VLVRPHSRTVEELLGRIAGTAHGVVTRAELLRAGVTVAEIKSRLRTGALLREHPGVYRVGHRAPSVEARYLAAVRACGERALLSGRAAAHLVGVVKGAAPPPEVITPTERRVRGVKTRRSRRMSPEDATTWRGIPVTTVARTLLDLAAVLPVDDLARACHEAGVRHGTTAAEVEAVLARRPGSRGAAVLRRILHGDVRVALSRLEARFLARLREARLAMPQTNRLRLWTTG
jgi:predicted transcriptional regulator of viral defense system